MNTHERLVALRSAAGFLLAATIVIVADLRVGGGVGRDGIDLINDVIGAVLVVPGVARLRQAARDTPGTDTAASLAWAAALLHVPLVLAEEALRVGGSEIVAVSLASAVAGIGGASAAALVFARTLAAHTAEHDLAARWHRNAWWIAIAGGLPAVLSTLFADPAVLGPPGQEPTGTDIARLGGVGLLGGAALAFGLIALVMLLTALNQTRQLEPSSAAPKGHDASAS